MRLDARCDHAEGITLLALPIVKDESGLPEVSAATSDSLPRLSTKTSESDRQREVTRWVNASTRTSCSSAPATTTAPGNVADILDYLPRAVECRAAEDLRVVLKVGIQAWETYQEKVVGGD